MIHLVSSDLVRPIALSCIAAALLMAPPGSAAQTCPLSPVEPSTLHPLLVNAQASRRTGPDAVAFVSRLERDDDGAPGAYHRGLAGVEPDPGLDHICVGGSVMELKGRRLVNRYGEGGSVGRLGGRDAKTGTGRSQMCKADYIAIRDAGFPACGPDRPCMLWYGIASEPRACGFRSSYGDAADLRCGPPIRVHDAQGQPTDDYLTTTALRRPGAPGGTRIQSDYVDASRVPYIVLPGKLSFPVGTHWSVGDIALVSWRGRSVYTVVGDTGPADKLGEASRATLSALRAGKSADPIDIKEPASILVFPGTAQRLKARWPLTPADIAAEGRKLMASAGPAAAMARCAGFEAVR